MSRNPKADDAGIVISGGNIQSGALSIGSGSQAVQIAGETKAVPELREIQSRLEELKALIDAHSHSVADPEEVKGAVTAVGEELKKKAPSRLTVGSLLDGIQKAVGSVAGIAASVEAVKKAAIALFH